MRILITNQDVGILKIPTFKLTHLPAKNPGKRGEIAQNIPNPRHQSSYSQMMLGGVASAGSMYGLFTYNLP